MKIRILKPIVVDIEKHRLREVWDKSLNRWEEFYVENITYQGKYAYITTYEGDTLLNVPLESFEVVN